MISVLNNHFGADPSFNGSPLCMKSCRNMTALPALSASTQCNASSSDVINNPTSFNDTAIESLTKCVALPNPVGQSVR